MPTPAAYSSGPSPSNGSASGNTAINIAHTPGSMGPPPVSSVSISPSAGQSSTSSTTPQQTPANAPTSSSTSSSSGTATGVTPSQQAPASTPAAVVGSSASHYSHTSDADLGYTTDLLVRPPRTDLGNLQVHVHGVALSGAKSRVETQIRMRLELVRPVPAGADGRKGEEKVTASSIGATPEASAVAEARFGSPSNWQRIGSFTHIKLPPMTGTKRKSKKFQTLSVDPAKTLFVDATVVNATPPHQRVYVCDGCRARERKRVQRKKPGKGDGNTGADKSAAAGGEDKQQPTLDFSELFNGEPEPTREELQELGLDPDAKDVMQKAAGILEERARKRVVLFNCGDYVEFEHGEAVLPTRITCYCRHHKEKVGFCIIFTMRDWTGELLATGTTPPIMITDDHKASGGNGGNTQYHQLAAAAAAFGAGGSSAMRSLSITPAGPSSASIKQIGQRNRAVSIEEKEDSRSKGSGAGNGNGKESKRAKPYKRKVSNAKSDSTAAAVTPFSTVGGASTAATSPASAKGESPKSDALFDHINATGDNLSRLAEAMRESAAIRSPPQVQQAQHQQTHQQQQQQQQQQTASPPTAQHSARPLHPSAQGSLSPHTLQTMAHSEPGFDIGEFISMPDLSAASMPPQMPPPAAVASSTSSHHSATDSVQDAIMNGPAGHDRNQPLPKISRLVPGEGPTTGGIEVTVLGENFVEGITCIFGDTPAISTKVWASNTLVCVLPPSASPGPVIVSFKLPTYGLSETEPLYTPGGNTHMAFFNYIEITDRSLMELALQVVGLQMTGQMQSARDVAMRVVGSQNAHQQQQQQQSQQQGQGHQRTASGNEHSLALAAALQSRAAAGTSQSFQDSIISFLSVLDVDVEDESGRSDAIRLANSTGQTLLHLAVILGLQRLVDDLLRRGAPVNARDGSGFTALHFACLHGRIGIARRLLHHRGSADVINFAGRTPLDLARAFDQDDIVDLLEAESYSVVARSVSDFADSGVAWESDVDDDNPSSDEDEDAEDEEEEDEYEEVSEEEEQPVEVISSDAAAKKEKEALSEIRPVSKLLTIPAINNFFTRHDVGMDWAQKMQAMMPTMQMPAVPVFHLALPSPSALVAWPPTRSKRESKRPESASSSDEGDSDDSQGKVRHIWNMLFEQQQQQQQEPPTYEAALATSPQPDAEDKGEGSSQISSASSLDEPTAPQPPTKRKVQFRSAVESTQRESASTLSKAKRVGEDRMLFWFWLPALVLCLILVAFSGANSVLSWRDLLSYINVAI